MARTGMSNIIQIARVLGNAGTDDFTIGAEIYWTDDHIEDLLDMHRRDFQFDPIEVEPAQAVGSVEYKRFWTEPYLESGTVFYLQTANGSSVSTALYSVDYNRGLVEFASDTKGTAFYASGHTYDVHGAAADIWERKAAAAANSIDWSSDNHRINGSQYYDHCMKQAGRLRSMAKPISTIIYRGDME